MSASCSLATTRRPALAVMRVYHSYATGDLDQLEVKGVRSSATVVIQYSHSVDAHRIRDVLYIGPWYSGVPVRSAKVSAEQISRAVVSPRHTQDRPSGPATWVMLVLGCAYMFVLGCLLVAP